MKLPELPPKIQISPALIALLEEEKIEELLAMSQRDYLYWDKVKYLPMPEGVTPEQIWSLLKFRRNILKQEFNLADEEFVFTSTPQMQKELHELDLHFGGKLGAEQKLNTENKQQFLISSIMEEAISSSQIEGAVTTRKVAKEMLRQKRSPRSKSEQMILNNYTTINFIKSIVHEELTESRLLEIQRMMTQHTLDNLDDGGRFRISDDVNVVDVTDGEIMHHPPSKSKLKLLIPAFVHYFNNDDSKNFTHPAVKAAIIHFLIGYIHPFADGNGRTARALFYWFMLKKGYWLTEYLSISSIILKTKNQYAKAYLYSETDRLLIAPDLTYFIHYKLKTVRLAYNQLELYIKRKMTEQNDVSALMISESLNARQATILQWIMKSPQKILTVREVETRLSVANQTARTDLLKLVELHFLEAKYVDKKTQIFSAGTRLK